LTLFGLSVVIAATAVAMVEIDAGGKAGARAAYRRVLPKVGPILGVVLLAAVIIALVSLTSIGTLLSVWLIVRWAFLAQVVVLENVSGLSSLRRSARLVHEATAEAGDVLPAEGSPTVLTPASAQVCRRGLDT
jgi:hypothetical protein